MNAWIIETVKLNEIITLVSGYFGQESSLASIGYKINLLLETIKIFENLISTRQIDEIIHCEHLYFNSPRF